MDGSYLRWLRDLKPGNIYQEILEEYLLTFDNLTDKLERLDKALKERQSSNTLAVIAYADRANERRSWRYYKLVLNCGKKANGVKTVIARKLDCFIWGKMMDKTAWGITPCHHH